MKIELAGSKVTTQDQTSVPAEAGPSQDTKAAIRDHVTRKFNHAGR